MILIVSAHTLDLSGLESMHVLGPYKQLGPFMFVPNRLNSELCTELGRFI